VRVLDCNGRQQQGGLILKKNPEATIADIPERLLATARFGDWDDEMMDWWNPCAKSFREVMGKRGKNTPAPKNSIYGIIERDGERNFIASTHGMKKGVALSVTGRTANEAKRLLEDKLKLILEGGKRVSCPESDNSPRLKFLFLEALESGFLWVRWCFPATM
jgi:hypothetical protein